MRNKQIQYTGSYLAKVRATLPNGVERGIRINERLGTACWNVQKNGRLYHMSGYYVVSENGFSFIPALLEDHRWIIDVYKPRRKSYGAIASKQQADARTKMHCRNYYRKQKAA